MLIEQWNIQCAQKARSKAEFWTHVDYSNAEIVRWFQDLNGKENTVLDIGVTCELFNRSMRTGHSNDGWS